MRFFEAYFVWMVSSRLLFKLFKLSALKLSFSIIIIIMALLVTSLYRVALHLPIKLKLTQIKSNVGFWGERKPEYRGKNLSEQRREPRNSTSIWRRIPQSNPGHICGRRVLSPMLSFLTCQICLIHILSKQMMQINRHKYKRPFYSSVSSILDHELSLLTFTMTKDQHLQNIGFACELFNVEIT